MEVTFKISMDPLYAALSFYRRLKYEECAALCTEILEKNPYDQVCILAL